LILNPFKKSRRLSNTNRRNPFDLLAIDNVDDTIHQATRIEKQKVINPFLTNQIYAVNEAIDDDENIILQNMNSNPKNSEDIIPNEAPQHDNLNEQSPKMIKSITFKSFNPFTFTIPSSSADESLALNTFTSMEKSTVTVQWLQLMFYYSWIEGSIHPNILASGFFS
jgi:hypothetical protein